MIRLVTEIPPVAAPDAAWVKIRCTAECYPDIALFWEQDGGRAYLCMLDGNMVLANRGGDIEELAEFVSVISPHSIFSDAETLAAIGRKPQEAVFVMARPAAVSRQIPSDTLSSREIYDLLNRAGLSLPAYLDFAVDFCRRVNHGMAQYFALRNRCAAITLHTGRYALLNGIASAQKGCGTLALNGIMQKNAGRTILACCRGQLCGFYEKNGFEKIGQVGYWMGKI